MTEKHSLKTVDGGGFGRKIDLLLIKRDWGTGRKEKYL